jgi:hypothetical protein
MAPRLCACGCCQPTPLATRDRPNRGLVAGQPLRFLRGHSSRGNGNPAWKGGRRIAADGYVLVCEGSGKVRREHILIAERVLGRALPRNAVVHHVDEVRHNNANCNLAILQRDDHLELHRKMRVRARGGNPWTDRLCSMCKQPRNSSLFYWRSNPTGGKAIYEQRCIDCSRDYERRRKAGRVA